MPQPEACRTSSHGFPGYGAVIGGNFIEIGIQSHHRSDYRKR